MLKKKKLRFIMTDEPGGITLTEAFAGKCGDVHLGQGGVHLWVPGDDVDKEKEVIFDFRHRPLSEKSGETFEQGTRGHFVMARVALLVQYYPERVQKILEQFDYVLVPDKKIMNTPADFRARILSYEK